MRSLIASAGLVVMLSALGCATSREEQRRALVHQQNSDVAASNGQYGIAGDEQKKAADDHHSAVKKAISEGKPIPPQPARGDSAPPDPNR